MPELDYEEHGLGLTWIARELMARASHALVDHDGRVWLIDPLDTGDAIGRATALGEPAGVIQLLDRHARDCEAVAARLGVEHHRLPSALPGNPFQFVKVVDVPKWRELALWWPARRALVVSETLGSGRYFAVGSGPVGVHPMLRLVPPGALRRYQPEHLLFGHGPGVHGPQAAIALEQAYASSRRDLPRFLLKLPTFR